jgi:uncharacterized protein YegJ (DUF2314 family)
VRTAAASARSVRPMRSIRFLTAAASDRPPGSMRSMRVRAAAAACALFVSACGAPPENVAKVAANDPAMVAAVGRARATVGELVRRVENPPAAQQYLAAKVEMVEGDSREHMWVTHLRLQDGVLHGKLDNDPVLLREVKAGDPVRVSPDSISDWMAVDRAAVCGGFTTRVLAPREEAPAAEPTVRDTALCLALDSAGPR